METLKKEITHPNEQETRDVLGLEGYNYLGYQNGWRHIRFDEYGKETEDPDKTRSFGYSTKDYPDYGKCSVAKHPLNNKQHNPRGSNVTYWCDECKIFYKVDMSD